jgi:hypothetical protein
MGVGWDGWTTVVRKAEAAGAASLLLAGAAILFLLVGPIYATSGAACSSGGACVTYGGTEPLGWNSLLLVPLVSAALVLAGASLDRRTKLSTPIAGIGCLGLGTLTFLGVFSIGIFLLPADVAAGLALSCIQQGHTA